MKDMDTKTKLEASLKTAIRNNDDVSKRTIRMALSAIRLAEIEKGSPIDEITIVNILQKEVKGRRETIQDATKAMRPDIITEAEAEIAVINTFLPNQLTPEELQRMAEIVIAEIGAKSLADLGRVMKTLLPRVKGQATGDQVSQVVRQLLQSS